MSAKARSLVERLQMAYNKIDHHLRATIGYRRGVPFASLIEETVTLTKQDRELLQLGSRVRNLLVHDRIQPHEYAVTPSSSVVEQLELLEQRLGRPERAIPAFQKVVERLTPFDSLAKVLGKIRERDYSQFPVFDGTAFRGLLTENGVTRWLARHVTIEISRVYLDDVLVKAVLNQEEDAKTNWVFVRGSETVDRLRQLFAEREMLEAVLITESGRQSEKLLGIATRWDMLNWRREHKSA
jgi:predicted transcriptional regulator